MEVVTNSECVCFPRPADSRMKQSLSGRLPCVCGDDYGNYVAVLYLVIKLLYLANCLAQLVLLGAFLDADYLTLGVAVVSSLSRGRDWRVATRFPRVTLCDFEVGRCTAL